MKLFNFAIKIKLNFEGQQRRYKGVGKQLPTTKYPNDKRLLIKSK
jgi:hypothetical protein